MEQGGECIQTKRLVGKLDYPVETIMCFEVKALSSALFLSTRFGPKLRFSVGRVP